jgi:hypothetical protein
MSQFQTQAADLPLQDDAPLQMGAPTPLHINAKPGSIFGFRPGNKSNSRKTSQATKQSQTEADLVPYSEDTSDNEKAHDSADLEEDGLAIGGAGAVQDSSPNGIPHSGLMFLLFSSCPHFYFKQCPKLMNNLQMRMKGLPCRLSKEKASIISTQALVWFFIHFPCCLYL